MFRQLTEEEYDLEFLEARSERLANGITDDTPNYEFVDTGCSSGDSEQETITRESFLSDLQKVSRRIGKPKPSAKQSKT